MTATLTRKFMPLALLASLAAVPAITLHAQQQPTPAAQRIAVCNPARVFINMDERKAVEDRIRSQREAIRNEAQKRQLELRDIQLQRDQLKPDSAQYQEKNSLLMNRAVEFEVWGRLKEAEAQRIEKEQIRMLFDKIADACKVVAQARQIDLVLAERRPEIPADMKDINPDQLRALLAQRDVLFVDPQRADITEAVTTELNRQFAAPPPAPAPAPAPAPGR